MELLYGPMPPANLVPRVKEISSSIREKYKLTLLEVTVEDFPLIRWSLFLASPISEVSKDRNDVLISSDGCWPHYLNDTVVELVIENGLNFAWFNRVEFAHDNSDGSRSGRVYETWPDIPWSAISIWAWAFHRAIDALETYSPNLFSSYNIIGHSRSGKAALIAASFDARISTVISNNSGIGGASSLKSKSVGSESLFSLAEHFPHWLTPGALEIEVLNEIIENDLPKSWIEKIAPRGLLILQARDDLWADPVGTRAMNQSISEKWQERPENLMLHERDGGHPLEAADWQQAIHFILGRQTS